MGLLELAFGAVVTMGAVVLGWWLGLRTARDERKGALDDQMAIRRNEALAALTMLVDSYDLGSQSVSGMDSIPERRDYFERWRSRIQPIEHEVRTLALLEPGDTQEQVWDLAKSLSMLLLVLDNATDEGVTQPLLIEVDNRVQNVAGEVNVVGALWKDEPK